MEIQYFNFFINIATMDVESHKYMSLLLYCVSFTISKDCCPNSPYGEQGQHFENIQMEEQ